MPANEYLFLTHQGERFNNVDTIVGEIFQEDDTNKDGVISLDEYQQV